jgi:DNA-binding SARP family transcriptional activator
VRYNDGVEFRILGPLEMTDGERAVSFDAPKQRTLLGVLLLHANEVVSSERLIDELWGEQPPVTAVKAVQTYVSQLRRALGRDVIATRPPGYALCAEEDALDAARFRSLVAEARRLAASGEVERADAVYREALALWRGPPLADVVFESFARNEVERLGEERLDALMSRIDCDLALGWHDELVAELETLVKQYPLRERLRAQLMLALYRCGRQAEALAVYQDARRTLVEELGLEPGREVQDLEKAILTHDPTMEAPPRAARALPVRRRLLRWRVLALASLVALAVSLGLAFALQGQEEPSLQLGSNSVGFIDADSGRVTRSFPVGREPRALAVGFGSVWVANYRDQIVTRIDRAAGHPLAIPVPGHPTGIAAFQSSIWVWTLEGLLVPIDPRFNEPGRRIRLQAQAANVVGKVLGGIAADGGFLWVAAPPTSVIRIDPTDPLRLRTIVPDAGAQGPIACRRDEAWVAGSDQVFPIDAPTGIPGSGIPVGDVRDLVLAHGKLWVVSGGPAHVGGVAQALRRVDPHTRLVEATIQVGSDPISVAAAGGSIWVAARTDGTIERVDPAQNRVVDTIPVGAKPSALAAADDGVWVAVG